MGKVVEHDLGGRWGSPFGLASRSDVGTLPE
jgi:hypothetical protein